jgi:hypothetical protein
MAENHYHAILGLPPELFAPDYYQLLELDPDDDLTAARVEEGFKAQMSKVQHVKSTKYKDLVEFIKAELKEARRALSEPARRKKYDEGRIEDVEQRVVEQIEMFIQISGDLSELEISEIKRRGRLVNVPDRRTEQLIDEILGRFGHKRTKASAGQIRRAAAVMQMRAERAGGKPGAADGAGGVDADVAAEIDRLRSRAARWKKFALLGAVWGVWRTLAGVVAVAAAVAAILLAVAPQTLEQPLVGAFGDAAYPAFLGAPHPKLDAQREAAESAKRDLVAAQAEIDRLTAQIDTTPLKLAQEAFIAGDADAVRDQLAEAGDSPDAAAIAALIRDRVEPERLGLASRWEWTFDGPQIAFSGATGASQADGGLTLSIPGRAPALDDLATGATPIGFEHPFGAGFRAGIIEIRGEWLSERGALGIELFRDPALGPQATPVARTVVARVGADCRIMQRMLDLSGAEPGITADSGETFILEPLPGDSREFTLSVVVGRSRAWVGGGSLEHRMATQFDGYYHQDGVSAPDGRVRAPLEQPNLEVAGRPALIAAPGTRVRLTSIVVR